MGPPPRDVVVISSDEDEGSPRWSVSPGSLGWVALLGDSPRRKKGKSRGVRARKDNDDDDCVILDGDPDGPAVVAGAKGSSAGDGASDEVEIVAAKGELLHDMLLQIPCKDFPHSRHLCAELPFSATSHPKHCKMCYCYVCDAPAPCKHWGKGLLNDDHCHATDKETKWTTLRQAFKCKTLPEKHQNFEPGEETTVSVGNLPYGFDIKHLRQLFRLGRDANCEF